MGLDDWARFALAPLGQTPAKHHQLLITELEAVALGKVDRLMLLLPPGAAKSTYSSVLFPAWWFTQHPQSAIIAAAHTYNLAAHFGRRARNMVAEHAEQLGYRLTRNERASANWSTDRGGNYFAAGVGGPITGRRADLVLVDDPIKSLQQAHSSSRREQLWEWFRSELTPRLKPRGRIVLIMTRWHPDDLGGRLLAEQAIGGDAWRCLRLPALAEADDPLGRALGAPLWPEWESAEALVRKRTIIGERTWSALYQQWPQTTHGLLFKVERIAIIDESEAYPSSTIRSGRPAMVRAWDLAATAEAPRRDADWTVGLRLWRDAANRFVVQDVQRFRGGPYEVEQAIINTARRDGRDVTVALPQDPGQAGRAQVVYFARLLAGFHLTASPETGAKATRALPVASQAEAGNLVVAQAPWNRAFLEELRDFPNGTKDDQVDALSRAFACLVELGAPAREIAIPIMQR